MLLAPLLLYQKVLEHVLVLHQDLLLLLLLLLVRVLSLELGLPAVLLLLQSCQLLCSQYLRVR